MQAKGAFYNKEATGTGLGSWSEIDLEGRPVWRRTGGFLDGRTAQALWSVNVTDARLYQDRWSPRFDQFWFRLAIRRFDSHGGRCSQLHRLPPGRFRRP